MSTVHNSAKEGEIAKNVIMPGDPLRAKLIAEKYLTELKVVSNVRGIAVYTGKYKNQEITVMASGMGMPSMMIYAWELFDTYEVENIIRVGTCGGYLDKTKIGDIIFSMNTSTDSNIQTHFDIPSDWNYSPAADFELLSRAVTIAKDKKINYHVGTTVCSDAFYTLKNMKPDFYKEKVWSNVNVLGSEMESYALYGCANLFNKKALALFTVSGNKNDKVGLTPKEREQQLTNMIEIALETLV